MQAALSYKTREEVKSAGILYEAINAFFFNLQT